MGISVSNTEPLPAPVWLDALLVSGDDPSQPANKTLMPLQTRRRALGLLIAAFASARALAPATNARAQTDGEESQAPLDEAASSEPDCLDSRTMGAWTAQASDVSAGATQNEVPLLNPKASDLFLKFQVNSEFDSRIYVEGSPEGTPLPEAMLRNPESRFLARRADGRVVVNTPLCGNCIDIYDDTVSLVLPLATAPLLRDEKAMEIVLRLAGKDEDCRFPIDCVAMRKALDWATTRRDELAADEENNRCASVEGCFITTACCEVLGLGEDCFELRTLRRYRDLVLAKQPNGVAEIARYYALAPRILRNLRANASQADRTLLVAYARFVLPASVAARLGLNATAYRLYVGMLEWLSRKALGQRPLPASNVLRCPTPAPWS